MKYLLLALISFQVNAIDLTYDLIKIKVPKDELEEVGSYKGDFALFGKKNGVDWIISMSKDRFQADCIVIKRYVNHDCKPESRFETIEKAINHPKNKNFLDIMLEKGWDKIYNIEKKDHDETVSYIMTEKKITPDLIKASVVINVNKKTFKTFLIEGNFHLREIQWFEFP